MATIQKITPFILKWEGGLSNAKTDAASADYCPFPFNGVSNWHTNKGITWTIWKSYHGANINSAETFFAMSPEYWSEIAKKEFWDKCFLDKLNSQRIANLIFDWIWMSGRYYPTKEIQHTIDVIFNQHLKEDGILGGGAIQVMNSVDENNLYNDLIIDKTQYLKKAAAELDAKHEGQGEANLKGWMNRLNDLIEYNK